MLGTVARLHSSTRVRHLISVTAQTLIETASEKREFLYLLMCDISFLRNDGDFSLQPFENVPVANKMKTEESQSTN